MDDKYKYPIRGEMLRVNDEDKTWCRVKVELRKNREGNLVLSITGEAGDVYSEEAVDEETKRSLVDYFAERNPDMTEEELSRHANEALSYGDAGGIEVVGDAPNGGMLVLPSCGCLHDEIRKWFPEVAPYIKWHLNDMRQGPEGKSWVYEPLPPEVIAWAESFGEE
jgi:hypothetical protein